MPETSSLLRTALGVALARRVCQGRALGSFVALTTVAFVACRPPGAPNASLNVPPLTLEHGASGSFTILHTNDIHGDLNEFVVDTGVTTSTPLWVCEHRWTTLANVGA